MKTQQIKMNTLNLTSYTKLILIALAATLMTACGTSKSDPKNTSSPVYDFGSSKLLANCNKSKNDHFSINVASVTDSLGQASTEYIKMKFNFLSPTVTTSGNTIKFFKWRVNGATAQLDENPLSFAKYDMTSGSTVGSTVSAMNVLELSHSYGLYIQLNDPYAQFQVLKAVVYNSSNAIAAQMNILIPGFYASPTDYQYNSDGTARSTTLQQMHALYGQDTTGWTQLQAQQHFDQYCF